MPLGEPTIAQIAKPVEMTPIRTALAPKSTSELQPAGFNYTPILTSAHGALPLSREGIKDIFKKREINHFAEQVQDDLQEPEVVIHPLKQVEITKEEYGKMQTTDYTAGIDQELARLAKKVQLEVGTERTDLLQDFVDRMADGLDIQTRVVIMNRGEAPNAFVYQDGTICISQSLINLLTLDETVAVLAHELNHLRFKTHERANAGSLSVRWTHEMSSDTATPDLLDKIGLNSRALASALNKTNPDNARGTDHQSPQMRSAEIGAVHRVQDYETSNKPHTPLPEILKGEAQPTNLEVYHKIVTRIDLLNDPSDFFSKFHPTDLHTIHGSVTDKMPDRIIQSFYQEIKRRLNTAGYSDSEARLFYACAQNVVGDSFNIFGSIDEIVEAVAEIDTFSPKYLEMYRLLFDDSPHQTYTDDVEKGLFRNLKSIIRSKDINSTQSMRSFNLDSQEFKDLIDKINSIPGLEQNPWRKVKVGGLIYGYLESAFRDVLDGKKDFDEAAITTSMSEYRDFFDGISRDQIKTITYGPYGNFFPDEKKDENVRQPPLARFKALFEQTMFSGEEVEEETTPQLDPSQIQKMFEVIPDIRDALRSAGLHIVQNESSIKPGEIERVLMEGIDQADTTVDYNFLRSQREGINLEPKDIRRLTSLYQCHLKMSAIILSYKHADTDTKGPEMLEKISEVIRAHQQDIETLSLSERINLFDFLFNSHGVIYSGKAKRGAIEADNSDNFFTSRKSLPIIYDSLPMQLIRDKLGDLPVGSITEINNSLQHIKDEVFMWRGRSNAGMFAGAYGQQPHFFDDDVFVVVVGDRIRQGLIAALEGNITDDQLPLLTNILIDCLPKGPQKDQYLAKVDARVLGSINLSLDDRIQYLDENFDRCGYEGLTTLADQVETYDDYLLVRTAMLPKIDEYLSGNSRTNQLAGADIVSSNFSGDYQQLLESANPSPSVKSRLSNLMANRWLDTHVLRKNRMGTIGYRHNSYDSQSHKIILGDGVGLSISSMKDTIRSLQALGRNTRVGITLKALLESGGALSNPENRKKLKATLLSSLGLKPGFVSSAFEAAITHLDADVLGLPASQVLGPLLFQAYDTDSVDYEGFVDSHLSKGGRLAYEENPLKRKLASRLIDGDRLGGVVGSAEDLRHLLSSDTHDILDYGIDPDTEFGRLFRQVRPQYLGLSTTLDRMLLGDPQEAEKGSKSEIDPSSEAVIRGVEALGPIGYRSLQLATQLHRFSPEMKRRLSESLDSNPGMSKLVFWNNLHSLVEKKPEIADFVRQRLIRVKGYLGGGSLNTTYGADIRMEDGSERQTVLKMLTPNAATDIAVTHAAATTTLEAVKRESPKYAREARKALTLVDKSNQWCIADINDPRFMEDNAEYRDHIAGLNIEGVEAYIPDVHLHTMRLKCEDEASGTTARKFIQDEVINPEDRKRLVAGLGMLFNYELNMPRVDENGETVYLMRSDPHVGNQMVTGASDGEDKLRVGLIDRHMYLRLQEADVAIGRKLMSGDTREAAQLLMDRVLDVNKVKSPVTRRLFKLRLLQQHLLDRTKAGYDESEFMVRLSDLCTRQGYDIPLQLQLMIKNVESMKQLLAQDFEDEEPNSGLSQAA